MAKFIFITGGVVSSLGKGLLSASIGALLQSRGYKIKLRKLDPYLNMDPGTMSPTEHGEVFVTDDGAETDLDLGHYERFTGINAEGFDNITTGKIYSYLLENERKGKYLGTTAQVIPHVTNIIKDFIFNNSKDYDFIICEIGGTVGDIEALPFLEALRQIQYTKGQDNTCFIHVTLLPYMSKAKELKTKPTQHSVKELRSIGIQPNILVCRAERKIPKKHLKKIALSSNIPADMVIPATDSSSMYEVPLSYMKNGLDAKIIKHCAIKKASEPDMNKWIEAAATYNNPKHNVTIAIVGKYIKIRDAYKSLIEALQHSGIALESKVSIKMINGRKLTADNVHEKLSACDGIIVPGGFGEDGVEGKIEAIKYARTNKIPFLGICMGMQLAIIETARNVAKLDSVGSEEFGEYKHNIVHFAKEWSTDCNTTKQVRSTDGDMGGTMRLGIYKCKLLPSSKAHTIYKSDIIEERHRHRFEINHEYKDMLEKNNLIFSGTHIDGKLPEIIERDDHPWFIGTQFHPELKSRIFSPHPLFNALIQASLDHNNKSK